MVTFKMACIVNPRRQFQINDRKVIINVYSGDLSAVEVYSYIRGAISEDASSRQVSLSPALGTICLPLE